MCIFSLKCICSFLIMLFIILYLRNNEETMVTVSMITLSVKYIYFFYT